jgi:hypothetical protein
MSITSYPNLITFSGGVGSYPYYLQVSRGLIPGHKRLFKFGFNSDIDDSIEDIWDVGGVYAYQSSAVTMTATSGGGATDNGVEVTIQGLDASYNELSEVVTLAGSGIATTSGTFLRTFRAFISGSQEPTGNINITNGGTTYAQIQDNEHQTLMALWTVPAGYTAYLFQTDVTAFTEQSNKFATIQIQTRELNGVFRTRDKFAIVENSHKQEYVAPIPILEKTDIRVRAIASSSNANLEISAGLDIIYIEN